MALKYQFNVFTGTLDIVSEENIVDGTAQGQMLFWDDTAKLWTYTETNELFWDDTNKFLGLGIASPLAKFHVEDGSILAKGTTGALPTTGAGTRFMWYPAKAAIRAGIVTGTQWDDSNIGSGSVALGRNVTASAEAAYAVGDNSTASGTQSVAIGGGNTASGSGSVSIGANSLSSGGESVSLGSRAFASADAALAFGLNVEAGGALAHAIGIGVNAANKMTNSTMWSLGIGYNSTIPTFYVGSASGIGTYGHVGIGETSPTARLHLMAGTATAGTAPFKLTTGVNLTTPEDGAIEYDGTNLYFTDSTPTRQTLLTTSVADANYLKLDTSNDPLTGDLEVTGSVFMTDANGPTMVNEAAAFWNPTLIPNRSDPDTGIGWNSANRMTLVVGGIAAAHILRTGALTHWAINSTPLPTVQFSIRRSATVANEIAMFTTANATTTAGTGVKGLFNQVSAQNSSGALGQIFGNYNHTVAQMTGTGTLLSQFAMYNLHQQTSANAITFSYGTYSVFQATNTGTVGTAYNFYSILNLSAGATVTNFEHVHINDKQGTGALTNQYGLYIAELIGGTNNFSIYCAGTLDAHSAIADGASAIAHLFDTVNAFTTSGAKLVSWQNNSVEQAFLDKDGNFTMLGATLTGLTQGSILFSGVGGIVSENNPKFYWDDTNERLSVGTNANTITVGGSALGIGFSSRKSGSTNPIEVAGIRHTNVGLLGATLLGARSRGTEASPTIVQNNDDVLLIAGAAYDGTDYEELAHILFEVDGTPASNDMPGRMTFKTTPSGSTTPVSHLRLNSDGDAWWMSDGSGWPYGEIYFKDNVTTTTLNSAANVQITDFDTNGESNQTIPDETNDHITIDIAGRYLITISLSVENVAAQAHIIDVSAFINNGATELSNVHSHRALTGGGGDLGSITLSGIVDLDVNDTVEVWATTDAAANRDVIFEDCTLSIVQVGG